MNKLSLSEQISFAKRLAFLVKGNVPLHESLRIIATQSSKQRKEFFENIAGEVSAGRHLSSSLADSGQRFSSLFIETIRAGEESGLLVPNLSRLAVTLEKRQVLKRKVVGSLVYPLCIGIATILLSLFLTVFIFPKIRPLLENTHTVLPLSTRALMSISSYMRHYGIMTFFVLLIAVLAGIYIIKKNERLRLLISRGILSLPILGTLSRNYHSATITHALGLMLSSGMPLHRAMILISEGTENRAYRRELSATAEKIRAGEQLSKNFSLLPAFFPTHICHLIEVAESAGSLPETLLYIGDSLEAEIDASTKTMTGLVEPILMAVMGLIVGFIALSIITPLYALTQNIHR